MIKSSNTVDKKRSFACYEFPVTNQYSILESEHSGFQEQTPIKMLFKAYYLFFICLLDK